MRGLELADDTAEAGGTGWFAELLDSTGTVGAAEAQLGEQRLKLEKIGTEGV